MRSLTAWNKNIHNKYNGERQVFIIHLLENMHDYYSILARFLAIASSTALSSRRSSSLLEVVFAAFPLPEDADSTWGSADCLSGLIADGMDDDTASFLAAGASGTEGESRGRFLNAEGLSLLLLASDLAGGEWGAGCLDGSELSFRVTDWNEISENKIRQHKNVIITIMIIIIMTFRHPDSENTINNARCWTSSVHTYNHSHDYHFLLFKTWSSVAL